MWPEAEVARRPRSGAERRRTVAEHGADEIAAVVRRRAERMFSENPSSKPPTLYASTRFRAWPIYTRPKPKMHTGKFR